MNRKDCLQDVYRPRGGSLRQWADLRPEIIDDPYVEADELASIANDLQNQGIVELGEGWD